ncbi:ParB/RepB/Spo0J family partition protein [Tsukamurella ocularis]|uniref:ParB/RepB/Spo0J family partition protein n=1 Tax=Tsukamurella ocularis TaxID=1970234 RepID=UPI002169CD6E|nr:ParB N-terminal domain-containing protein [Tsukamurella ocularis]MCS3853283.1 ParB family chromosome partitioning protein [Tsukamurella ocularis]
MTTKARKTGGPRGSMFDFSSLPVGGDSPVDGGTRTFAEGQYRQDVPLADLVANPRNPRRDNGDLSQLATIVERQLQPGTAVSRPLWLKLWPEDEADIGQAKWIVINGCRRLAACHKYGKAGMDIVVRDGLAVDKQTVLWAAITENIDRQDFDVLEEARAVDLLVAELGNGERAAERLGRSKGWISQRRALLKLVPELHDALRSGELPVRVARELATRPAAEQVSAWSDAKSEQEASRNTPVAGDETETGTEAPAPKTGEGRGSRPRPPATPSSAAKTIRRLKATPQVLGEALVDCLDKNDLAELIAILEGRTQN